MDLNSNSRQIGGDHYKRKYQHWDFVCDTHMHYLLACATKYISRWRKKNGIQDLEKSVHYLDKATEKFIRGVDCKCIEFVELFTGQIEHISDREIIVEICMGNYNTAQNKIRHLIMGHKVIDKD